MKLLIVFAYIHYFSDHVKIVMTTKMSSLVVIGKVLEDTGGDAQDHQRKDQAHVTDVQGHVMVIEKDTEVEGSHLIHHYQHSCHFYCHYHGGFHL